MRERPRVREATKTQKNTSNCDRAEVAVVVFRDGQSSGGGQEWDDGGGDSVGNDAVGGGDEVVGGGVVFVEPGA